MIEFLQEICLVLSIEIAGVVATAISLFVFWKVMTNNRKHQH